MIQDTEQEELIRSKPLENRSKTLPVPLPATPTTSIHSYHSNAISNVVQETAAFAATYLQVRLKDRSNPYVALTNAGRFNHYIVDPYFRWHGQNDRIVNTPSLGRVGVQTLDKCDQGRVAINGGSHNYAGFYGLSPKDESLHGRCLDQLPLADAEAVPLLHGLMLKSLASFFDADCCYSTTTGFQSNMLGIPAIVSNNTLIIVDEKSHNSIFTAAFATGKSNPVKRFKHNDMTQLESILIAARSENSTNQNQDILVIVEGLYSMDGTTPDLGQLYQLKRTYNYILYVDEAHSFGSIGKTGRGCLELWNDEHPDYQIPADVIDIRSAVLSKAVGGLGGVVLATSCFKDKLERRAIELSQRGESLTTSTMLQTLSFLAQPKRLRRNLHRLRDISRFCHEELKRLGVRVYGDSHVPMLPIYGGRPSKASELSHVLRKVGLVTSPTSAPAVDFWESRCRITLSASYTDADVNQLIDVVVEASRQVGLCKAKNVCRQIYRYVEDPDMKNALACENESQQVYLYLDDLLRQQVTQLRKGKSPSQRRFENNCALSVKEAGHSARRRYGVGSGSARWILGTFLPHIETEELLAKVLKQPSAMTYPDSDLGLMSTVASLCRPIIGRTKHYFLLPVKLSSTVEEGLRVASKKSATTFIRYADHESLVPIFRALVASKDTYVTLFIEPLLDGVYVDLKNLANRLASGIANLRGCTLLLDDPTGLGQYGLGVTGSVDMAVVCRILSARLLISGSFYHGIGLPGGYLAGDTVLIDELRYTSRCYMFTTSPQPFVMAMIAEALNLRLPRQAGKGKKTDLAKNSLLRGGQGGFGKARVLGRHLGSVRSFATRCFAFLFTLVFSFLLASRIFF